VRQAAAIAVRRDDIVKAAFYGRARALESLPFDSSGPFFDEARSHGWAYDPKRARALLAEAGLASGFSCSLLATSTYGMIQSTAEVIQSNLAEVGIKAGLVLPDWATRVAVGNRGQFDIAVNGTTNESNDPDGMSNFIETDLPNNYTRSFGLSLPRIDALVAEGRRTFDLERRKAIYAEVEKLAVEQVPMVSLCWRDQGYAMVRELMDFTDMPGALTFYSAMTLETASFG
jgi:peptide/nickel transport system substrate-binding protein